MRAALISSSALILALTVLRLLFRGRISRRFQYALWGLVLLRLALPVSLPEARFSVLTGARRLAEAGAVETVRPSVPAQAAPLPAVSANAAGTAPVDVFPAPAPIARAFDRDTAVRTVWLTGSVLLLAWFAAVNLRFARRLRANRTPFDAPDFPLPVYVSDAAVSPCLFGLIRPAVYLTRRAADEPPERLRHILTHELCHCRQGDHVWALLRALALAAYWFNPFVWLAAALSKLDGEFACDEAALERLGREARFDYGRTLVDMVAVKPARAGLLCTATAMVSGKRGLKKRLERIVRGKKPLLWAAALTAAIVAALVGCTFTGAKPTEPPEPSNTLTYEKPESAGRRDRYRWRCDLDENFRRATVWAEVWRDGELTSTRQLCDAEVPEGNPSLDVDFLANLRKEAEVGAGFDGTTLATSLPLPPSAGACGTSWLASGGEPYTVTAGEPAILLCAAFDTGDTLQSFDCEYLMEEPERLREYECAVVVRCCFTDGETEYQIPAPDEEDAGTEKRDPAPEEAKGLTVASNYEVALLRDGEETALDSLEPTLPERVVMDGLVKSAAWPIEDEIMAGRPYMFRLRQILTSEEGEETHDYYACRLNNGVSVLWMGGWYTTLSEDLMVELETAAGIKPAQLYNLDAAVSRAILDYAGEGDGFLTESHVTLRVNQGHVPATVYCVALDLRFDLEDGKLVETGGSHMPVVLDFWRDVNGAYHLENYWTPEDGNDYAPSIREKFPPDIAEDALDMQRYAMAQTQACYAEAIDHYGLDLTDEIERRIGAVLADPNGNEPSPWAESGYLEYRQLLFYGDETLRYLFGEFLKGNQTGERAELMGELLRELLGGENLKESTGDAQAYFDEWKAHVLRLYEENPLSYFEEHAPKAYLLLEELGLTKPAAQEAETFDAPAAPRVLPLPGGDGPAAIYDPAASS